MPRGKAKHDPDNPDAPSQMGAVRQALESLGYDAKPPAIAGYISDTFNGMTVKPNMISSYKSQLKAQKKRRGRPPATDGAAPAKDTSSNVNLKDLQEVKSLAGRLGVAKLRKLVEYLA